MIGFDIGGTKCAVSVVEHTKKGVQITDKKVIPTDLSVSPETMIDRMCALAEEMTDDFSRIGISCGGPLDSKKGVILSPPNLKGWDNVEIVKILTKPGLWLQYMTTREPDDSQIEVALTSLKEVLTDNKEDDKW